jgi:hypothetical protein
MFVFVTQKFVFVTQIVVFVTQKIKVGLQKGTGYKKERFWVTKKNVTICMGFLA